MPAAVETMVSGRGIIPWHGLGVIEPGLLTPQEAYVKGGLNWEVEKVPQGNLVNGVWLPVPNMFNVIRTDTNATLGTSVTEVYKCGNNAVLFELAEIITNEAKFETAGVLDNGTRVWAMLSLAESMLKIAGDDITPYFLLTIGHDGKNSLVCTITGTRVVCQNTLTLALKNALRRFSSKHMGENMTTEGLQKAAAEILALTKMYYVEFEKEANELLKIPVTQSQMETLVTTIVAPAKKDEESMSKRGKTMLDQARELVFKAMVAADLENVKGTGWWAYNGVVDYLDHGRSVKKADKDPRGAAEREWLRTFEDNAIKDETIKYLTSLV